VFGSDTSHGHIKVYLASCTCSLRV